MTNTDLFAKGLKVLKEIEAALTDDQWETLQGILCEARDSLPEELQQDLADVTQELNDITLESLTECDEPIAAILTC